MTHSPRRIADAGMAGLVVGAVQAALWNGMLVIAGPHSAGTTSAREFSDPNPAVVLELYVVLAGISFAGVFGSLRWVRIGDCVGWSAGILLIEFALSLILSVPLDALRGGAAFLLAPTLAILLIAVCLLPDRKHKLLSRDM